MTKGKRPGDIDPRHPILFPCTNRCLSVKVACHCKDDTVALTTVHGGDELKGIGQETLGVAHECAPLPAPVTGAQLVDMQEDPTPPLTQTGRIFEDRLKVPDRGGKFPLRGNNETVSPVKCRQWPPAPERDSISIRAMPAIGSRRAVTGDGRHLGSAYWRQTVRALPIF